jgi:hypothetical protein
MTELRKLQLAVRRERHERECEEVALSAPRLRRMNGRWQTLGADGNWRNFL